MIEKPVALGALEPSSNITLRRVPWIEANCGGAGVLDPENASHARCATPWHLNTYHLQP